MRASDYKILGFSLLELVIVIAIIAILGTVGFVKLTDYFIRNNLEKDAQKIAFTLKNARDRSMSQDRGLQWGVHFENPADGQGFYELFAGASYPGQTILRNNLNTGVEFLNPSVSSTLNILFSKVTGLISGSGQSWSHIQTNAVNPRTAINALAFTSVNTSGNLIVAEVDWSNTSNFTSISDSQGNTYTQIGTEQNSASVVVKSRLYYAKNIKAGANTITTVVSGAPSGHELYIHEYSGLDPTNPLDSYSVNVNSGSTFTSNNLTTTQANDLLYGIDIDQGTGTASAGWTTRSTLDNNVAADKNAPTTGSYAFTGNSSGAFVVWIAAFKSIDLSVIISLKDDVSIFKTISIPTGVGEIGY